MKLHKLYIHNYKSLRNVEFMPTSLCCLVGPNASGKSNFVDAVHFLSEVYKHGLEVAIARKGGYENIAFRKQRRSKAPIEFVTTMKLEKRDLRMIDIRRRHNTQKQNKKTVEIEASEYLVKHSFSIRTLSSGIQAEFEVTQEIISLYSVDEGKEKEISRVEFDINKNPKITKSEDNQASWLVSETERLSGFYREGGDRKGSINIPGSKQNLIVGSAGPMISLIGSLLARELSNFHVFQFSPQISRNSGVPTPNPLLGSKGDNLPALVSWLQSKHKDAWSLVLRGMQDILPGLENIDVQYLHTKTLGIIFTEEGVGRGWDADDVSDGTIQALAILVASADPRSTLLVIEEIENSIHPWIISVLVQKMKEVSKNKIVILTSHSPTVINQLRPNEIWITSRKQGETSITPLCDIDPSIKKDWEMGKYLLSDFLDSGLIPQAVPGGAN